MSASISRLSHDASLDAIWTELVYTEARLLADASARDLAAPIAALLARVEATMASQRGAWRAEIAAQAAVDAADDGLDDAVGQLARTLLTETGQHRDAPLFRRYFPHAPNVMTRMGLEAELAAVRAWVGSLASEASTALQAIGKRVGQAVAAGDGALEARRTASAATADHRVREIATLVDDTNAARLSLFGTLVQRGTAAGLAPDWAGRFFRHASHAPRGRGEAEGAG